VGRRFDEVIDITARICGICPAAYQMTAAHAFERLFDVDLPPETRELRRLFYCGEWIQSHMLHVHFLAAPDFLGLPDAFGMVEHDRAAFERGLRLRSIGADIMAVIGGRAVHPVSPRVGGFSRSPQPTELRRLLPRVERAADDILGVADWVAGFDAPSLPRPTELMALVHPAEYPMNEGTVRAGSDAITPGGFEARIRQVEVGHSSARHAVISGHGPAVVGPLARFNLNASHLTPLAQEAARRLSLRAPELDPFRTVAVRVVETALAIDEARRLIKAYVPPSPAVVPVVPRAGRATWITEAPRGVLYHRYDLDDGGVVQAACLVPPTCHNLPNMEADIRRVAGDSLDRPDAELARLCEMAVRNYDPCISCATHLVRIVR
jgi:coenzyme F420-reducing hydrogenase alpha subunit